jgi:hypothetical protein
MVELTIPPYSTSHTMGDKGSEKKKARQAENEAAKKERNEKKAGEGTGGKKRKLLDTPKETPNPRGLMVLINNPPDDEATSMDESSSSNEDDERSPLASKKPKKKRSRIVNEETEDTVMGDGGPTQAVKTPNREREGEPQPSQVNKSSDKGKWKQSQLPRLNKSSDKRVEEGPQQREPETTEDVEMIDPFESMLEQEDEDEDVIFSYGEPSRSDKKTREAEKEERRANQWILDYKPKPKVFFENHMEPWGPAKETQVETFISSLKLFVFAAVAGRLGNEAKKSLAGEAATKVLGTPIQSIMAIRKEHPWYLVQVKTKDDEKRLLEQAMVLNQFHRTMVVFRPFRKTAYQTRCAHILRVTEDLENPLKKAMERLCPPSSKIALRRRAPIDDIMQTDIMCVIMLEKEEVKAFQLPKQIKLQTGVDGSTATGSWEMKRAVGCYICHSSDHFDNECPWQQKVEKDFKIRIDHGEEKRKRPPPEKVE